MPCTNCNRKFRWWNIHYYCDKCENYFCYRCKKELIFSIFKEQSQYYLCNQCLNLIDTSVLVLDRTDEDIIKNSKSIGIVSSRELYKYQDALIDLKYSALKKGAFVVLNVTAIKDQEQVQVEEKTTVKVYGVPIPLSNSEKIYSRFTLKGEAFKNIAKGQSA